MQISNETKKNEIACCARMTKNMFQRIKGLLFEKNFSKTDALVITPCNGVHSIGMRFEFDAIYLDKNLKVLRIFEKVLPNRVLAVSFKTDSVLELPSGTISAKNIEVNDVLKFNYE